MDEYISRRAAQAELLAAWADGRIATAEDIVSVLDLVPAAAIEALVGLVIRKEGPGG